MFDDVDVCCTHGRPHAVRLGVDQAADLRQVTVALRDELDGGGLHQEGVVGRQHAMDALLHALHNHGLTPAVHELPHLIVRRDLAFLQSGCNQTGIQQKRLLTKFFPDMKISK